MKYVVRYKPQSAIAFYYSHIIDTRDLTFRSFHSNHRDCLKLSLKYIRYILQNGNGGPDYQVDRMKITPIIEL